jgi:hypothetical protein
MYVKQPTQLVEGFKGKFCCQHDPCLFEGVLVCLLDSRNGERGGYPVSPPTTCIDISHVAEKYLIFRLGG